MQDRGSPLLLTALFVAAVVLGGASAPTSWGGFAFQVVSLVILVIGIARLGQGDRAPMPGWTWLAWGMCALVLAHLLPLPPALWSALPGRALVAENLELVGAQLPALPLSLAPSASVAAALGGLPVAALLVLLVRAPKIPVTSVSVTLIVLALLSWTLGVLQVVGGGESALYFHAITSRGLAVGFFANANHLATLLALCVPLAAALAAEANERSFIGRYALAAVIAFVGIAALGITLTGSVAGIVVLGVSMVASLFVAPASAKARSGALLGGLAASAAAVVFSIGVLGTSFEDGQGSRPEIWRTSTDGIAQFWPIGSGVGTFPAVYPTLENAQSVGAKFINHAHNDYLEVLFEAGLPGALLIAAVLGWWILQSVRAWRETDRASAVWRRASSIVVGLLLAHSLVDYPLRTPAILLIAVFYASVLAASSRAEEIPPAIGVK